MMESRKTEEKMASGSTCRRLSMTRLEDTREEHGRTAQMSQRCMCFEVELWKCCEVALWK